VPTRCSLVDDHGSALGRARCAPVHRHKGARELLSAPRRDVHIRVPNGLERVSRRPSRGETGPAGRDRDLRDSLRRSPTSQIV
jgi:hypothetical protein